MELTPREKWIAITAIMKTSQNSKNLSREDRDQLFLYLHKNHAPALDNPEIQQIERDVVDMGKAIVSGMMGEATKYMGTEDKKEIFDKAEEKVGKENAEFIKNKLQESNDKDLV
jgi:hypothetical protein